MRVNVATHRSVYDHDTGDRHPERPERVTAVLQGLKDSRVPINIVEAPRVERDDLNRVHDPAYVDAVEGFCLEGGGALDPDTRVVPESWEAALRSAGAVTALVEMLENAEADTTGFAVTRPPGHHALAAQAMGFCLFNNVAVASAVLRAREQRVAILDWDVHHGNGTQAMLADDAGVLYVSLHQDSFYPFEGHPDDIDSGAPGTTVNVPLPEGTAGDVYREAWDTVVVPVVTQFRPDWVFVSAGYDAHVNDPLAELALTEADYGWMTSRITPLIPPNRTVLALEGGYDLEALFSGAAATVRGLAGESDWIDPLESPPQSQFALDRARGSIARHWNL